MSSISTFLLPPLWTSSRLVARLSLTEIMSTASLDITLPCVYVVFWLAVVGGMEVKLSGLLFPKTPLAGGLQWQLCPPPSPAQRPLVMTVYTPWATSSAASHVNYSVSDAWSYWFTDLQLICLVYYFLGIQFRLH